MWRRFGGCTVALTSAPTGPAVSSVCVLSWIHTEPAEPEFERLSDGPGMLHEEHLRFGLSTLRQHPAEDPLSWMQLHMWTSAGPGASMVP